MLGWIVAFWAYINQLFQVSFQSISPNRKYIYHIFVERFPGSFDLTFYDVEWLHGLPRGELLVPKSGLGPTDVEGALWLYLW